MQTRKVLTAQRVLLKFPVKSYREFFSTNREFIAVNRDAWVS